MDLFQKLSDLFEEGHAKDLSGQLLNDANLAGDKRLTPAAVLIAVTDRPEPGVILTQRPRDMRDHPGQVAFPGGKCDPGEDAITAALREAEEELALPRDQVRVIGTGDLYTTGTGFDVTPVLAVIPPDLPLIPSPGEVEAWFEAPLSLLLDPNVWTKQEIFWKGQMRSYLELEYEGFRIWGVTAAIIANLAKRIGWDAS
ncbi:CoA pyrophosphatase [Erythrobacter sp. SCSIO 43205]|uniref:CoA pyrophosphatase n=1 Tax=Erythrobacter sp. SCSIO 43205 TaxID=2779361 RepID=UPI001CA9CDDA|nr:CoA pyrophosphatase [Erythrobacter sp. SCSIO 43205]UAB79426.1 CoA pyrophosphatase [Erythrobacter sp. SCSIO 43205]